MVPENFNGKKLIFGVRYDWFAGGVIGGIGLVLAGLHSYHGILELGRGLPALVSGVVFPLAVSILLLGDGYRIARRDWTDANPLRIIVWFIGGGALGVVLFGLLFMYQAAEAVTLAHPLFVIGMFATYGSATGLLVGRYDIERQIERERQQQKSEQLERYETLVEVSGDPMYMLDDEGHFTYVNDALVEITGFSEGELLGEHVQTVMAEEHVERGNNLIRSLISSGEQYGTFELDIHTKTGERIPVENHMALLYFDEEFRGSLGVLRDITARLERERKLQRERDRLDRFASVVSHDLRNPLNVATGRLELAMEESESEHLEPVAEGLDRMQTLIDDVLRLARAGETVGETEAVELDELGHTCWRNVETNSAQLLTETDAVIRADETRLQQLFENLFRNAIDHVGDDVTVTVGKLDDGFYVEDDGPGIPEAERDDVFEAGYSSREEGTGFGLSIVKEIVEAHDWEMRVTEGTEGGARFEITGVEFTAE